MALFQLSECRICLAVFGMILGLVKNALFDSVWLCGMILGLTLFGFVCFGFVGNNFFEMLMFWLKMTTFVIPARTRTRLRN